MNDGCQPDKHGTTDQPRDLVQIGTFTRRIGGHVVGDKITRPMCAACEELTRAVVPSDDGG